MAVGSPELSSILRKYLAEASFDVIENDVFHRNFLNEIISIENPDMLILHDRFLPSDAKTDEERDSEMLELLNDWRVTFEGLRVVYLCERDRHDSFLGDLAARNVFDIFHERQIDPNILISQLQEAPRYSNVTMYGLGSLTIQYEQSKAEEPVEQVAVEIEDAAPLTDQNTSPSEKRTLPKLPKKMKAPKEKVQKPPKVVRPITKIERPINVKLPSLQIHVHKIMEEQKLQVSVGRKIILVVSPFERMGSSFISHQLAYQIAKHGRPVQYFENPFRFPYTYDRFAGHLTSPNFISSYSVNSLMNLEHSPIKWEVEGVSLEALNPGKEKTLKEEDITISRFLRMFLAKHDTPYLIVDIGSDTEKAVYDELIEVASHVFVVMEPDIPKLELFEEQKLHPQFNWIHRIKNLDKTKLVVNRFIEEASDALPMEDYFTVGSFSDAAIFQSQYKGTFSFSSREATRMQETEFASLLKDVLADDYYPSKSKRKGLFPRFKITKA